MSQKWFTLTAGIFLVRRPVTSEIVSAMFDSLLEFGPLWRFGGDISRTSIKMFDLWKSARYWSQSTTLFLGCHPDFGQWINFLNGCPFLYCQLMSHDVKLINALFIFVKQIHWFSKHVYDIYMTDVDRCFLCQECLDILILHFVNEWNKLKQFNICILIGLSLKH